MVGIEGFSRHRRKNGFPPGRPISLWSENAGRRSDAGRFIYREIDAPSRIVLVSAFSDETGGVARHPMSASRPLEMLSLFELEAEETARR
jgi:hypothetical protein